VGSLAGRLLAALVFASVATSVAGGAAIASGATYAKGVDVSHWNGPIDWLSVTSASYRFAYAKATEGTTIADVTYPLNRAAKSLGLRFGGYHFARPGGSGDAGIAANAIAQADYFLNVAQPLAGELPPVLDLETKGGLSPAALEAWANAWLNEVDARTGVAALVYTSPNFWKNALIETQSVASAGHSLWVAHWTTGAAPLVPAGNWAGQSWTFWQWTDCVEVPGFAHCSDGDRFNGADPAAVAIPKYPSGPPAGSSPPTIVGVAQTGKTLAGIPGTWAGGKPVTFVYQWQRCDAAGGTCIPIVGATGETYLPVADDIGHALVLTVTAQALGGSASSASPPTVAVAAGGTTAARPAVTTAPTVTGTPVVGQSLSSSVGAWTGAPSSFAYQWRRCSATGGECVAIVGATAATYTLTPDDIGATVSLVITATGKGGSTAAPAAVTPVVAAAPVPPAVPGSAVAQPGLAGAVSTPDGTATVTWQPGAVPIGSTVSLATSGKGLVLGVSPTIAQLPWPVDLAYAAAPAGDVVGYSTDGRVWLAASSLQTPTLPLGQIAGTYADAAGLVHVLLRAPLRVALFKPGAWGDPSRVAAGLPTPRLVTPLHVKRQRDGSLLLTTRVFLPSQAHLWIGLQGGAARQSLVLKPGSVPVRLHVSARRLGRRTLARLRIAARDPWGRRAALVVPFRAP
jgi:GH25 family lysozyme M1 (1,4-beta-N-acetylmuramidase)